MCLEYDQNYCVSSMYRWQLTILGTFSLYNCSLVVVCDDRYTSAISHIFGIASYRTKLWLRGLNSRKHSKQRRQTRIVYILNWLLRGGGMGPYYSLLGLANAKRMTLYLSNYYGSIPENSVNFYSSIHKIFYYMIWLYLCL